MRDASSVRVALPAVSFSLSDAPSLSAPAGACTSTLLRILYDDNKTPKTTMTFVEVLNEVRERLSKKGKHERAECALFTVLTVHCSLFTVHCVYCAVFTVMCAMLVNVNDRLAHLHCRLLADSANVSLPPH
jgi:hypothetical protein